MTPAGPSREAYFYLSHARQKSGGVDYWVRTFFEDLHDEVRDRPRRNPELDIGTGDLQPTSVDRDSEIDRAVAGARVFVPLFSPEYVAAPPRDSQLFLDSNVPAGQRISKVQPVLWVPLPPDRRFPHLTAALELGGDLPDYARHGLSALSRLRSHANDYGTVVRRLAGRIVEAAELPAAGAQAEPVRLSLPVRAGISFIIAVIAPSENRIASHRQRNCYDSRPTNWRPFRNDNYLPIADHTARVAGAMRMPTLIVDFAGNDNFLDTSPGVILVDPWVLEHHGGREMVRAAFDALRQWVTMVVVVDRNDPQYDQGSLLIDEVVQIGRGNANHKVVRDQDEFKQQIGKLISRARRHYLNRPPDEDPSG
ncbi:FxsC protein [Asanoa siamensis]|uniref:TIR domain-containing protein n=1 Tax=Asanoa siamensis TaxID=926357 RepID=A0ABQ4CNQ9_9ACTN|nr:FxsC protein [Asanoa siamensis]GIF72919.1 hypothetical protein Asi02nite_24370 [Asanoa siamensis]